MNKELVKMRLINVLNGIKRLDSKVHDLYKIGFDIISFSDDFNKIIELLIECFLDEEGVELVYWWLYESVSKIIYNIKDNACDINVENVEDFVDYLIENNLVKNT